MNVFEDLIIELKEENLLESTVMDTDPSDSAYDFSRDANGTQVVPGRAHRMLAQWDGTPELGSVFGAGLLE